MWFAKPKPQAILPLALLLLPAAVAHAAPRAAAPFPSLVPGESLRYRIEYRSNITSRAAGPISTPESAHQLSLSLSAVLRLDVLGVKSAPKQGSETRLRVTYETCDARVQSDAYDPGAKELAKQYQALQGRSFEFTIDAHGRVGHIAGLDRLAPDPRARSAIRQWLSALTLPMGLPRPGLKPGRKWKREVPAAGAPLAGLAWRTESLYRDREPCPPAPGAPAAIQRETCAVISTKLEAVRRGRHTTPLAYARRGLRTRGRWLARGNSLSYVSLSTGLVTSNTSTENDAMDITITAALSGSKLRYAGKIQSTSQITLIGLKR